MKKIILLMMVWAGFVCTTNAQPVLTGQQESAIDSVFFDEIKGRVPGCSCGVISDGEFVYNKSFGFANLEHNVPVTEHTVFDLASVSKQFTATLIAVLEEQDALTFSDPVTKYLSDFPSYGDKITFRHLIHHTSGLRDFFALWQYADRDLYDRTPKDAIYEMIKNQKGLDADPGVEYRYSNSNYFLLELIIEEITGKSFQEAARIYLLDPLEMDDTKVLESYEHVVGNLAQTYWQTDDGAFRKYQNKYDINGASGVLTTMEDMLKWDRNFSANRLGEANPQLIQTLENSMSLNDGTELNYGFGQQMYEYRSLPYIYHSGTIAGFRTRYIRFPNEKVSIVILCNLLNYSPYRLSQLVSDIVLEDKFPELAPEYDGRGFPNSGGEMPTISQDSLKMFTGIFYSEEIDHSHAFYIENGKLYARIGVMHDPEELQYSGDQTFQSVNSSISYSFSKSDSGGFDVVELNASRVLNLKFIKQ